MDKMRVNDYKMLKEALELTGLNEKQVRYLLQKVEYVVTNAVYDAKKELPN